MTINKEPEAQIFELADIGVVGDPHTVAQERTGKFNERMG